MSQGGNLSATPTDGQNRGDVREPRSLGEQWEQAIRREQVRIVVRQGPFLAIVNLVNAALIAGMVGGDVPLVSLFLWLIGTGLIAVYPLRTWWAFRFRPRRAKGSRRSVRRVTYQSGLAGLIWASAAPLFAPYLDDTRTLFLYIVLSGMAAGGAVTLGSLPHASLAYTASIGLVVLAHVLSVGTPTYISLGVMLGLFFLVTSFASRSVFWAAAEALKAEALATKDRMRTQGRFSDFAEISADWFWESDIHGRMSEVAAKRRARSADVSLSFDGMWLTDLHPVREEQDRALDTAIGRGEPVRDLICAMTAEDGTARRLSVNAVPVLADDDTVVGYRGTFTDVTAVDVARERAEAAETTLRDAIEALSEGFVLFDSNDRLVLHNDKYKELFGSVAHLLTPGVPFTTLLQAQLDAGILDLKPDEIESYIANRLAERRKGTDGKYQYFADGRIVRLSERRTRDGGIVSIRTDVTQLERARIAAEESQQRVRAIAESLPLPLLITRKSDSVVLYANPQVEKVLGVAAKDIVGQPSRNYYWDPAVRDERTKQFDVDGFVPDMRVDVRRANGEKATVDVSSRIIRYDGEEAIVGTLMDVTERLALEEQLHQAQKMQAVGELTGGVAHDFNNLLAAILSSAEMLQAGIVTDAETTAKLLDTIVRASERGAGLTRQLLAFSRRQTLTPETVDLSSLVDDMGELLRRTLGEGVDIEVRKAPALWSCLADPSQLENAILNLAINARDAMPSGGCVKIDVENVDEAAASAMPFDLDSGDYVVLSVSDTGTGMPPSIAERAFDPFFTTKSVGEGTGLGLSMVYGFAKQSGGHATIDSAPGRGTTINIFLPRARTAPTVLSTVSDGSQMDGQETVLVLEDDADVRAAAVAMLRSLGYRVHQAGTGEEALALLQCDIHIDLLLSDVVLPGGLSGPDVARQAKASRPDLKTVFMSGYPDKIVGASDALLHEGELLQKPFRRQALAARLRETLDEVQRAS